MLVVHAFWSTSNGLCLWAEDSDLAVKCPSQALRTARPHPFAASADVINEATGYAAALVAPLLLPDDITMLIDERAAMIDEIVYTPTGEGCTALGIHSVDLLSLCAAKPVPL